jgi:ABC-type transport system involved in multi-copper enzyme maturation permease subunit
VQVGLFATSPLYVVTTTSLGTSSGFASPSLATGTFDNVSLTGSGSGASGSWAGTAVGSEGTGTGPAAEGGQFAGSFTRTGDTFSVTGSGDIAPAVPSDPGSSGQDREELLSTAPAGLIVMIIVAGLFITAEYRRGLIRVTFAASPRRGRVLAAKAAVIGAVTFVLGAAGAALALVLGTHFIGTAGDPVLADSALTQVRMTLGTGAMLAVCAVLALALGALVRRGVAAITVVIVVIFVPFMLAIVEGLLPAGLEEWLLRVTPAAAFAVIQDIPAYHQVIAQYVPAGGFFPLSWWAGLGVLCLWAAAALAGATYLLRRRDV